MDDLTGNIENYVIKNQQYFKRWDPKKENGMFLKASKCNFNSDDHTVLAYITHRF